MRAWTGPALFSFGFRPFFLFACIWALVAMLVWIAMLNGLSQLPSRFSPASWHAHEFLFGYLGAVLAGFLLTAVPNWTGRLPMVGARLMALFGLWCIGRIAVLTSDLTPVGFAMVLDLAFPIALAGAILQEIIVGRNWRNLIVLALLAVFAIANTLFHIEATKTGVAAQGYGLRLGVASAILMIAVIGGRIIPSFTRNWLAKADTVVRPVPPMQQFDRVTLLVSLPSLALWVIWPEHVATASFLAVMSVLHFIRLSRWQGHHTFREPLVWVLHVGYGFIPLGGVALALDIFLDIGNQAAAQHLWMAGAIGTMTLAVMTRATLGHTGQPLVAGKGTVAIYLCFIGAVIFRDLAVVSPAMITLSGLLWIAAFGVFVGVFGPLLWRPRAG